MDYFGGSVPHILTSTNVLKLALQSAAATNYFTVVQPSTAEYTICQGCDYFASSYRSEGSTSTAINFKNGITRFGNNTGNAGGFAAFTPNYVLSIKPTNAINLSPITATAASAITAAEGDMVFVSDTNGTFTSIGFWGYQNGTWTKM